MTKNLKPLLFASLIIAAVVIIGTLEYKERVKADDERVTKASKEEYNQEELMTITLQACKIASEIGSTIAQERDLGVPKELLQRATLKSLEKAMDGYPKTKDLNLAIQASTIQKAYSDPPPTGKQLNEYAFKLCVIYLQSEVKIEDIMKEMRKN